MLRRFRSRRVVVAVALAGCLAIAAFLGSRLRAQVENSGPETPEEASKAFLALLLGVRGAPEGGSLTTMISGKSSTALGEDGVNRLLSELRAEFIVNQWKPKAQLNGNGNGATVQFTRTEDMPPIVCIREGEHWFVDLVATFGKWNHLDQQQSLQRISTLTGVIIPGVPVNETAANSTCQSYMKQVGLGIAQYCQDFDERYPPANKWCDVIQPYVRSQTILNCPKAGAKDYGYAMNWKFSRRDWGTIETPATSVLQYESNVLQRNRNGDGKDLTFRHEIDATLGANYGYADGHVKWNRQDSLQEFRIVITPPKKAPVRRGPVAIPHLR